MHDISVEITTYNRKDLLAEVLERLALQDYPLDRFEVVLSDDGSTDGLLEMVEARVKDLPYKISLLRHQHSGPGHAHNAGILACTADLVLMLAADVLPEPGLVSAHVQCHQMHPQRNIVVSGRLRQSPALPPTVVQKAANIEIEKIFRSESKLVEHGGFLVSNLSFKKSFMVNYGMFHEWPPASGEDIELGYRLQLAGMQVIECKQALGLHHHEETLQSIATRAYMTGYNSLHFSAEVDAPWVRRRFGFSEPGQSIGQRLVVGIRTCLRNLTVNRITANTVMVPSIKLAEKWPVFGALAPLMCRKYAAYFFKRGLADSRRGYPFRQP